MTTVSPPLNVKDMSVFYGSAPALVDVTIGVSTPSRIAVLGPSGCGKSTLVSAIGGFCSPTARVIGTVECAGPVGFVAQDSYGALNPLMRLVDQVALTAGSAAAAEALLSSVGLGEDTWRAYPVELSGGQRQRALLAFALGHSPKMLITDEVTSALDPVATVAVCEVLAEHSGPENGRSVLFISHDVGAARMLCDAAIIFSPSTKVPGARTAHLVGKEDPWISS